MNWRLVCFCSGVALYAVATVRPAAHVSPPAAGAARQEPLGREAGGLRFTDVTAAAGLTFQHTNGGSGRQFFIEQLGSGAAFFDYDGDGSLDIFFAQGVPLPGFTATAPTAPALFHNNGNGTFTDVSKGSGLVTPRFSLGVASADYDSDGDVDLFVTALGGNLLFRNEGRGRFAEVAASAGLSGVDLSTSASFFDYDDDGWLDLFVARYGSYAIESDAGCEVTMSLLPADPPPAGGPAPTKHCGPDDFKGVTNRLYRNKGDGTFEDRTDPAGIGRAVGHGLGVAVADYDADGRVDVFVASDRLPNMLFMNQGNGTFKDTALAAGVALGAEGRAYAGMGVDAGDYDNDGDMDLFITNYENEPSSLYRNLGDGNFADESQRSRISALSLAFLKWGTRFVDFDRDGRLDIFVVNGHVDERAVTYPVQVEHLQKGRGYAQRAQVYRNAGRGRFEDESTSAGPYFLEKYVARGAAFGDYDNDGDTDVLVTNNNQRAVLLRNETRAAAPWARLALTGAAPNREGIGAVVRVTAEGLTQTQTVKSGGSYLSDHDRRLLFALPGGRPATAQIRWPCGATQTVALEPGASVRVTEKGCLRARR